MKTQAEKVETTVAYLAKSNSKPAAVAKAATGLGLDGDDKAAFIAAVEARRQSRRAAEKAARDTTAAANAAYRERHPEFRFVAADFANAADIRELLSIAAETVAASAGWSLRARSVTSFYFEHETGATFRVSDHVPVYLNCIATGTIYPQMAGFPPADIVEFTRTEIERAIATQQS